MRGTLAAVAMSSVAAAAVACSLVIPSVAQLSGGDGDGGIDQGHGDGAPSPGADGSTDGSTDGDAGGDGAPGTSCASQSGTFCDDFDHAALGALWNGTTAPPGTLALDADAAVSLPNSLLFTIPAKNQDTFLLKTFAASTGTFAGIRCELDLRVDAASPAGGFTLFAFTPSPDATVMYSHLSLSLLANPTSLAFIEYEQLAGGGTVNPTVPVTNVVLGRWFHVAFDASFRDCKVTVGLDDQPTVVARGISPPSSVTKVDMTLGATGVFAPANATSWQVRADNVACSVATQ